MRKVWVLGLVAVLVLAVSSLALAADEPGTKTEKKTVEKKAPAKKVVPPMAFAKEAKVGTKATDPVDKTVVTVAKDTPNSEYNKKFYYFASADNKTKFDADPTAFVKAAKAAKTVEKKVEKKAEKKVEKKAEPAKAEPAPAPAPAPAPK
jgi:YHS domain-containing protein